MCLIIAKLLKPKLPKTRDDEKDENSKQPLSGESQIWPYCTPQYLHIFYTPTNPTYNPMWKITEVCWLLQELFSLPMVTYHAPACQTALQLFLFFTQPFGALSLWIASTLSPSSIWSLRSLLSPGFVVSNIGQIVSLLAKPLGSLVSLGSLISLVSCSKCTLVPERVNVLVISFSDHSHLK